DTHHGRLSGASPLNAEAHMRAAQALSEMFGVSMPGAPLEGPAPIGLRGTPSGHGGFGATGGQLPAANPDFQNLLRQIAMQASSSNMGVLDSGLPAASASAHAL